VTHSTLSFKNSDPTSKKTQYVSIKKIFTTDKISQRKTMISDQIFVVREIESVKARKMAVQYGNTCMSQRKVYEWVETFKREEASIDDLCSGGPFSVKR
jgi:hypothetical protein